MFSFAERSKKRLNDEQHKSRGLCQFESHVPWIQIAALRRRLPGRNVVVTNCLIKGIKTQLGLRRPIVDDQSLALMSSSSFTL